MRFKITTFDSHAINDQTNYDAVIQPGNSMPPATAEFISVGQTNPALANKIVDGGYFTINIISRGNIETQRDELNKWFMTDDFTFRNLVAQDLDNSNKEWYLECYPVTPPLLGDESVAKYSVTFALRQPYWRPVITSSDSWSITASGQPKVLTVLGNKTARPVFTITPTAGKTGGYKYAKNLPWYNPYVLGKGSSQNNEPLEITNGGLDCNALLADNSNKCLVNVGGGINASVTTIPYDTVTGTIPSSGLIYIDTEQISYTGKTGTTSGNITGCVRGVNTSVAASHADNAVIYTSKLMYNLNDLRVYVDGKEVDRWFAGGGASVRIWINQSCPPQPYLTLNTSIASSGSVTTISVTNTYAYQGDKVVQSEMLKLPASFLFIIGTEIFAASAIDVNRLTFTVSGRAVKNTSMASHAVGDRIYWISHDIYLVYGNPSAIAPTTDDTKKPILDLTNSTNTSWVYTEFSDAAGLRTGAWKSSGSVANQYLSRTYTGSHLLIADPATEAGITVNAWLGSGVWLAPYSFFFSSFLKWTISHPATITAVTVTGAKYRWTADWPVFSLTGLSTIFTEATPSTTNSWEALSSHAAVSTLYNSLYPSTLVFTITSGTLAGSFGNSAAMEFQAATLALDSTRVMQYMGTIAENSAFFIDSTLTNSTTGEAISFTLTIELNKVLTIDCDAEGVVYNGYDIGCPLRWNTVRLSWLDLAPGSNTLTYTDTGTIPGITVAIAWKDRNTL
jgi:hypothetical protein